jgi:hypothetical protein
MKNYLTNAFSLSMMSEMASALIRVEEINPIDIPQEIVSIVGHETTAKIFESILGRHIECHRVSIKLTPDDIVYIGQYSGPRLPEGATELPEGAAIRWLKVSAISNYCANCPGLGACSGCKLIGWTHGEDM